MRGLLDCPCCLKAALVLILVLVLSSAALLWWAGRAMAGQSVELQVCSLKTCKSIDPAAQKLLGHGGYIQLRPEIVRSVGSVPGCDECSLVTVGNREHVYVTGKPVDVACKIFGGSPCTAK
jgi:hypothetical protein